MSTPISDTFELQLRARQRELQARLQAQPTAERCVDCQARAE